MEAGGALVPGGESHNSLNLIQLPLGMCRGYTHAGRSNQGSELGAGHGIMNTLCTLRVPKDQ